MSGKAHGLLFLPPGPASAPCGGSSTEREGKEWVSDSSGQQGRAGHEGFGLILADVGGASWYPGSKLQQRAGENGKYVLSVGAEQGQRRRGQLEIHVHAENISVHAATRHSAGILIIVDKSSARR